MTTGIYVVMTGMIVVTNTCVVVANVLFRLPEWLSEHSIFAETTRMPVGTTDGPIVTSLSVVAITDRLFYTTAVFVKTTEAAVIAGTKMSTVQQVSFPLRP